ncbi:MAG TPA: MFS transporter, partial [Candidatus Binataceae bacterium]
MSRRPEPSPYRWVIEALLVLSLSIQSLVWLAPAPLLDPIIKELHISLADSGLVISVIGACIAIFSMVGSMVAQRLGILHSFMLGIWALAIGQTLSGFAPGFFALIGCRVLEGIGLGLIISPPGALVMQWFQVSEWPYINMINSLCPYIGMTAVFRITAPFYYSLNQSWRGVMLGYGAVTVAIALAWTFLGRERNPEMNVGGGLAETADAASESLLLVEALRTRNVLFMALATFGAMWAFQMYIGFLPLFFQTYRGLSLDDASRLTAIFPTAGLVGALAVGFATGPTGLRKPFMWPVELFITLTGFLGSVTLTDSNLLRIALIMLGAGSAGSLVANTTLVMELPGMTPARMGAAQALIWGFGFTGAFISPPLGGALAQVFGLRQVMLGFLIFQVMEVIFLYLVPETGPRRRIRPTPKNSQ